jgi:hypothetical protein
LFFLVHSVVFSSSPEDEIFITFTIAQKGKKLLARAIPILYQNQILSIFFVYLRNLAKVVTSPRIDQVNRSLFVFSFVLLNKDVVVFRSLGPRKHQEDFWLFAHHHPQWLHSTNCVITPSTPRRSQ